MNTTEPQTTTQTGAFDCGEDELMRDLGFSRSMIRNLRGKRGEDWEVGPNGRVRWAEPAVRRLVAEIHEEKTAQPKAADPKPAPAPEKHPAETLAVSTKRVPNQRIVLAERTDGALVKVWVGGQADLFRAPMRLLARPGENDLWHWIGNPDQPTAGKRLPRRKGRW